MAGRRQADRNASRRPVRGRGTRRKAGQPRQRRTPPQPSAEGRVIVAEVRRPWGLDGSVAISAFSDDPARFGPGTCVYLGGKATKVISARRVGRGATVIRVESITSPEEAELVRGAAIEVDEAALPAPPDGAYYHYQVIGARVQTRTGDDLGEIVEIVSTGANDVYVARPDDPDRRELLIPAVGGVVLEVDVGAKVVVVDLPEGLGE